MFSVLNAVALAIAVSGPAWDDAKGEEAKAHRSMAAEPRLAVLLGLKCSACHTNVTGGGKRNAFGSTYQQTQLPSNIEGFTYKNPALTDWLSIGTDVRVEGSYAVQSATPRSAFEVNEANLYLEAQLLRRVLTVYIDQKVGPGNAAAREVFGMFTGLPAEGYAKVGKFFLPYGLRIVDDKEFIRDITGFNFTTPDQGVEVGIEPGQFSLSASLSNGSAGSAEGNDGKQVSGVASWVTRYFRVGGSASRNNLGDFNRDVVGAFAGLNIGPVALLGEVDRISGQDSNGQPKDELVAYGGGNWLITRGLNAKITYGYHDRNVDVAEDQRVRARFGLEYFPIPFLQASGFYVFRDDIPQAQDQHDIAVLELHFYF
jgi:hypothetical protein